MKKLIVLAWTSFHPLEGSVIESDAIFVGDLLRWYQ
jgi:hypothetical protein